ncbi:hypothetical protein T07_4957 [Trichinella nelsoni]|uniref:Uncharacterized protein n=1 Tax=Trichinella nelsoni TaxID=6336 RepID=A0A0V0RDS6_9BILA|nr:hypothetical protein T07_4957 [Trichinella nelsoni]
MKQPNSENLLNMVTMHHDEYALLYTFDYCSVHVSTVISHVSQQFRFLVFFIVTQCVVSVQWNYFYKLEYLSLMVVQVSLNALKRCTKILIKEQRCTIRNHVDKYVITKHYYQLMLLSLATSGFRDSVKGNN